MKSKALWVLVSCLIVVALVLASCGPAAVEEEGKRVVGKVVEKEGEVVEKEKEEAGEETRRIERVVPRAPVGGGRRRRRTEEE